jgi:hypothetical protein
MQDVYHTYRPQVSILFQPLDVFWALVVERSLAYYRRGRLNLSSLKTVEPAPYPCSLRSLAPACRQAWPLTGQFRNAGLDARHPHLYRLLVAHLAVVAAPLAVLDLDSWISSGSSL